MILVLIPITGLKIGVIIRGLIGRYNVFTPYQTSCCNIA